MTEFVRRMRARAHKADSMLFDKKMGQAWREEADEIERLQVRVALLEKALQETVGTLGSMNRALGPWASANVVLTHAEKILRRSWYER